MTKQEEIEQWLGNELDVHVAFKYSKQETAKDILNYLGSQGVVIKVDRVLPNTRCLSSLERATKRIYVDVPEHWDDVAMISYFTRITQHDMLKWHKDSLEPLIES